MFRVCARNSHSYPYLTQALGIGIEPTVWGFMTSKYSCTHDIGWTSDGSRGWSLQVGLPGDTSKRWCSVCARAHTVAVIIPLKKCESCHHKQVRGRLARLSQPTCR